MKTKSFLISHFSFLTLCLCVSVVKTQPPAFEIDHYVIASGGGASIGGSGPTYMVEGTTGQNIAGTLSTGFSTGGTHYAVRGGFWAFQAAPPTAAQVSVSGRVTTADGRPISRARVIFTAPDGAVRTGLTNPFGYYRVDEIESGQTYMVEVSSKHFQFVPRLVMVQEELTDLDFTALP